MIHVLDIVLDDLHPRGVIDLCVELPSEKELVRVVEQCCEIIRTVKPTRALKNEERRCNTRNERRISYPVCEWMGSVIGILASLN